MIRSIVAASLMGSATIGCARPPSGQQQPRAGFVDKVYQEPDGARSKYVVFLPHDYDGTKAFPAILFLHGAANQATTGSPK